MNVAQPLLIPSAVHVAMVAHCLRESPLECCGVLGGLGRIVDSFYPFRNAKQSETRYEADPSDVIRAVVELRKRGAEFVAIYHSHPKWQAVPSRTDLAENHYGDLPRIIVSLLDETPVVRAWKLCSDSYEEIPVTVLPTQVEPTTGTG